MGTIFSTTPPPKKLLFLDIDGVLNSTESDFGRKKHVIEEDLLQRLEKILDAVSDCAIVLSSSWRVKEELRELLKNKFYYLSCTPIAFTRTDEITYWLQKNTTFPIHKHCPEIDAVKNQKLFTSEQFPQEAWLLPQRLEDVTNFIVIDDSDLTTEKSPFIPLIKERFIHVNKKTGLSDSDVMKAIDLLMIRQ